MLHASGKYVSSILRFLQTFLNPEQSEILKNYHGNKSAYKKIDFGHEHLLFIILIPDLVMKLLTLAPDSEEVKSISSELDEKLAAVKAVASSYKKPGVVSAE